MKNVYNNPEYSEIREELLTELASLQEQYDDTDEGRSFLPKDDN